MSLKDFAAKTTSCEVELVGGSKVELTFRPFTLADLAWLQSEFSTEEQAIEIAGMKAAPLCKIMWNQLTPECKSFFSDITYDKFDEVTEEIEVVKLMGYQKLLHAIKDQENMLVAFTAYSEVENLNSFIPDEKKKESDQNEESSLNNWAEIYDKVAAQYGITPEQFYSFTPKQLQQCLKFLGIRLHNDLVMQMKLANKGDKMKFIDLEAEKLKDADPHNDDTIEKLDKATNDYLASVRAKYG